MNWIQWAMGILGVAIVALLGHGLRLWRDVDVERERVADLRRDVDEESARNDRQDARLADQGVMLGRIDENVKLLVRAQERDPRG